MKMKRAPRPIRRLLSCGCLVVLLIIIASGVMVAGIVGMLKPMGDLGNEFLIQLQTEDYETAYTMLAPDLQAQLASAASMRAQIREYRLQPQGWTLNSYSMNGNTGAIIGRIDLPENRNVALRLSLGSVNNEWKITGFWFGDVNVYSLNQ